MAVTANVLLVSVATINPPITNPPNKDRPIITTSRPWQTNAVAVVTNRLPTVGLSICLYVQFAVLKRQRGQKSRFQGHQRHAGISRASLLVLHGKGLPSACRGQATRNGPGKIRTSTNSWHNFASYATPIGQLVLYILWRTYKDSKVGSPARLSLLDGPVSSSAHAVGAPSWT